MADSPFSGKPIRTLAFLLAIIMLAALLPAGSTGLAEEAPVSFRYMGTFTNKGSTVVQVVSVTDRQADHGCQTATRCGTFLPALSS